MIKNKYLFFFENDRHIIVETKRIYQPKEAGPEHVYFWLMIDKKDKTCQRLNFLSMKKEPEQIRNFLEGTLMFNDKEAKFSNEVLSKKDVENILEETDLLIKNFIGRFNQN